MWTVGDSHPEGGQPSAENLYSKRGPYRDRTGHLTHAMGALYQMS